MSLYPILFDPSFHYRIWGGNKLKKFGKNIQEDHIGESWEISTVPDFVSVVANGNLKGKNLNELVQEYKGELVGNKVYQRYGNNFPLLIKLLDSDQSLSIQVHPNDEYAKKHHNSLGKTEMWYILEAEEGSEIIIGFEKDVDKEVYAKSIEDGTIENILRKVHPQKGDVFYIPAGRVHAIGKGIILAEIQQTSDVTYRIYDYNRIDKDGKLRQLHTQQAMDVADFSYIDEPANIYDKNASEAVLVNSPYFVTSRWEIDHVKHLENNSDSFKILICTEGDCTIETEVNTIAISKGQSLLLPASLKDVKIIPKTLTTLLEVHID